MLEMILGAILGALGKVLTDWLEGRRRDAANVALGGAQGSATLNRTIAEIADEQAANNALDRGGAADVLRGLRDGSSARRRADAG